MKIKITEEMKNVCRDLMYDKIYNENPEAYEEKEIADKLYDEIYEVLFGDIDEIEI